MNEPTPLTSSISPAESNAGYAQGQNSNPRGVRKALSFLHHFPTFREWFDDMWLDIATAVGVGFAAGGLNLIHVANTRQFVLFTNGVLAWPELAYERRDSFVPIWLDAFLAIVIPSVFFAIAQIRVRSFYDFNVAFFGNLYGIATTSLFQVFLKTLIGGFRPHFLSVCNPDLDALQTQNGKGFMGVMFDKSYCRPENEDWLRDALKSFPSGHTTTAFNGFLFLSLYFNGKMKIFGDERPHFYKYLMFYAPLLGATLIACNLTTENAHHWYDVLVGMIIGIIGGFAAYRMNYASIWDHRFNHIPLPRDKPTWSPLELFWPSNRPSSSEEGPLAEKPSQSTGAPIPPPRAQTWEDACYGRFEYSLSSSSDFPSWARGWKIRESTANYGGASWRDPHWNWRGASGDAVKEPSRVEPTTGLTPQYGAQSSLHYRGAEYR